MIIYKSPIESISYEELEMLSLKVAELETMLKWLTEHGDSTNETACLISATERLANWLQADVQALITAYNRQHPTLKAADKGGAA